MIFSISSRMSRSAVSTTMRRTSSSVIRTSTRRTASSTVASVTGCRGRGRDRRGRLLGRQERGERADERHLAARRPPRRSDRRGCRRTGRRGDGDRATQAPTPAGSAARAAPDRRAPRSRRSPHAKPGNGLIVRHARRNAPLASAASPPPTRPLFAREQRLDAGDQLLRLEGLDEHTIAPDGADPLLIDRLERAGQQQHRNVLQPRRLLDDAAIS